MKKVTSKPSDYKLFLTGNALWDQALCHYATHFPRLMAHVSQVAVGYKTQVFLPPFPDNSPFAQLTLRPDVRTKFEAIEDLGTTLTLLARYLRYHARTEAEETPVLLPPADDWGSPTRH